MFGLGMGELIIIAIVALLFLGPEKLPDAAKTISKGIRDFRKQTRELQQIVEDDHEIGGAIRDLKSALRGEELPSAVEEKRRREAEAARVKAAAIALGTKMPEEAKDATGDVARDAAAESAGAPDGAGPRTQRVSARDDAAEPSRPDAAAVAAGPTLPSATPDTPAVKPAPQAGAEDATHADGEGERDAPAAPEMTFFRPAQGTVAMTFPPGMSSFDADAASPDERDDGAPGDPADEAHG